MGFEITYKYCEKIEDGYNEGDVKTKTVKVGKPDDELALELVAGKIMAQLAKRSILVIDVEVVEFTKKKLNCKIEDDGIKIKGRKFSFEDGCSLASSEPVLDDAEYQLKELLENNPELKSKITTPSCVQPQVSPQATNKSLQAIRWENFDPIDNKMAKDLLATGLKFTVGNRYPIYEEKAAGDNALMGMLYKTKDDAGKIVKVSDKYFNLPTKLAGDFFEDNVKYVGQSDTYPKLSGDDDNSMYDVPVLRR